MARLIYVFLAIVLLALNKFSFGGDAPTKSCKAIVSDLSKRQIAGITSCSKSMTFKNGKDKAAKMNCIIKCTMMKEGLLDETGRISNETFYAFMEKEIPESLLPTILPPFEKCHQTTMEFIDPDEEFCKTYDPLIKCLLGAIAKMCLK